MSKSKLVAFLASGALLLMAGGVPVPAGAEAAGSLAVECTVTLHDFPNPVANDTNEDPNATPAVPFDGCDGTAAGGAAGATNDGTPFVWTAAPGTVSTPLLKYSEDCPVGAAFPPLGTANGVIKVVGQYATPASGAGEDLLATFAWQRVGLTAVVLLGVVTKDFGANVARYGFDENQNSDTTRPGITLNLNDPLDWNGTEPGPAAAATAVLVPREDMPHAGAVNTCPPDAGNDPLDVTVVGMAYGAGLGSKN